MLPPLPHRRPRFLAEPWRPALSASHDHAVIFHALQNHRLLRFSPIGLRSSCCPRSSRSHSLEYTLLIALVSQLVAALAVLTFDRPSELVIVTDAFADRCAGIGLCVLECAGLDLPPRRSRSLCSTGFSALPAPYHSELFPPRGCAPGVGFTYSWSRLSAVFSSLLIASCWCAAESAPGATLLRGDVRRGSEYPRSFGPRTNALHGAVAR